MDISTNLEHTTTRLRKATVVSRCDEVRAQHIFGETVKYHEALNLPQPVSEVRFEPKICRIRCISVIQSVVLEPHFERVPKTAKSDD